MQIVIALIVAAVVYGAGFASGWKIDTWKNTAEQAAELKAAQDALAQERSFRETVSSNFEQKLAKLRIVHTTIHQEVQHEIEKTVYGDPNCNLPDTGVVLRNAAIDAANDGVSSQSGAAVPAGAKDSGGKAGFLGRLVPSGPRSNQPVR